MTQTPVPEHLDVLIIGAGISGIDAGYHLSRNRPDSSFAILEAQDDIGGTWHTHRFPGIRSDSDLYTFGFKWKPWLGVPIATADEIMAYLSEAVTEQDLTRHIRFGNLVTDANWSSDTKRWTVCVTQGEVSKTIICKFLWMCAGYYRHSQGYVPDFPGREDFAGPVIHPQNWPEDLDYADKAIVSEKMRQRSVEEPDALADDLINGVRSYLGDDYDVETHFTPTYRPWEQRLAVVPEGDMFQAIARGDASVVTGHIAQFTKTGITLQDGQTLQADIIVTATGLLLNALGDIAFEIDGQPLELNKSFTHRGIMFSDVPNLVNVFGYLRSSWRRSGV
ncbi:FAD-containing monooxygenase EthA [Nymphon striatum]|nr:FAD-containing monooxygenase EthA [Nymphon striatum]